MFMMMGPSDDFDKSLKKVNLLFLLIHIIYIQTQKIVDPDKENTNNFCCKKKK